MKKSLTCLLLSSLLIANVYASDVGACGALDATIKKAASAKAQVTKDAIKKEPSKSIKEVPSTAKLSDKFEAAIANFKERYPKTKVNRFSLTPLLGIYEAAVAKEVIYFDQSARFLIAGRLLDMEKGEDLTDKRLKAIRKIDFNTLPLDKAVKTVYGKGTKQLAVFTDVDCPYSRKLSKTLEELKDVTVYTFLFPLESIHPQARAKSEAIWCATDSSSALKEGLEGKPVKGAIANNPLCEPVVDHVLKLAATHGIGGTPTLINEAGNRIAGALPLERLQDFVNEKVEEAS